MRIKSYFAESVSEAMEKARLELGPDAMLVHSKRVESGLRHLGAYEVVFGLVQGKSSSYEPTQSFLERPKPADQAQSLSQELSGLRRQLDAVSRSVSRQRYRLHPEAISLSPVSRELYEIVQDLDFAEDICEELVEKLEAQFRTDHLDVREKASSSRPALSVASMHVALRNELEQRLTVSPGIGRPGRKIVALIGAPGSGKTSTIVKLAIKEGLAHRIPVQILSTDTMRLGGVEGLGTYARIIGSGFQAVHSPSALDAALEEFKDKKFILIDTPGYDAGTISDAAEWIAYFVRNTQIEVELIMPANLRSSVVTQTLDRFSAFRPSKLLLTKIDEVETVGSMLEAALRSRLPVSYLGSGQQIPEDLEEASLERMLGSLPRGESSKSARTAA